MAVLPAGQGLVCPVPADIRLTADDRFDPCVLHCGIEINRAVQDAVIRNRARIHTQLLQPVHQSGDPAGAVQQAVLRMQMKMRKAHNPSGGRYRLSA